MLNVELGLRPCDMLKISQIIREATQHSTFNIQHSTFNIPIYTLSRELPQQLVRLGRSGF